MNKDEKSLTKLYEATLSPLNGVGMGPEAQDSAGGLGAPIPTQIDIENENEERGEIDDHEVSMAKSELFKLAEYAPKLLDLIKNYDELEGWVQAKITKASDYVSDVYHYLKYEEEQGVHGHQVDDEVEVVKIDNMENLDGPGQGLNDEIVKNLMSRF